MVGIARTPNWSGVPGCLSMSIFTIFTRSPYSAASSEMIGAICRHGAHHSAQKSMMAGLSDLSTSASKFWSVTSCTFATARFLSSFGRAGIPRLGPAMPERARRLPRPQASATGVRVERFRAGRVMGEREERDLRLARVRAAFEDSVATKRATLDACSGAICAAAERVIEGFRAGHKLLAFGNGGSASDAQHLCAELAGRYVRERPALPALALTANTSDLTAIGNYYGYD